MYAVCALLNTHRASVQNACNYNNNDKNENIQGVYTHIRAPQGPGCFKAVCVRNEAVSANLIFSPEIKLFGKKEN